MEKSGYYRKIFFEILFNNNQTVACDKIKLCIKSLPILDQPKVKLQLAAVYREFASLTNEAVWLKKAKKIESNADAFEYKALKKSVKKQKSLTKIERMLNAIPLPEDFGYNLLTLSRQLVMSKFLEDPQTFLKNSKQLYLVKLIIDIEKKNDIFDSNFWQPILSQWPDEVK